MSLVGTRPPTVDEWDKYELHHRARLATKPGLTGMWQVSGRSNITDFEEVVKLDKQYISEWTIYSLRGQFQSDDEFLKSLLENTLPVLKKIEEEEGIIYKDAMLWDCKVTSKCNLRDFLLTQRKPITTRLKICYQKLLNDPYYHYGI